MSEPAERSASATYDDLLALPEDVRAEVLAGQIVTTPAPLPKHARAQRSLARFVGGPFDDDDGRGGPGGWWILVEVAIRLETHEIVRPDLAGWRRERLPDPADVRPIDVPPDWVCEILSPTTAGRDRVHKRRLYARHGIPHYWIVDVDARTVEAFALDGDRWVLLGTWEDGDTIAIPPFEAIELEIGRLFFPR
ncbi:MAG: Uma2 family endonuclease [Sandaracinaceae bacterium]